MIFRAIKAFNVSLFTIFLAMAVSPLACAQGEIKLVEIKTVDPTIVIDLRYGAANNIAGRALYPPEMTALVRPEVAQRLVVAQAFLRRYGYGLKIWDAYRPKSVQLQLWQASRMNDYVADPATINGSLHSWGLAVDATLVDTRNQPVSMPTDFDDFTPAAMWHYQGADPLIRAHLTLLQCAMRDAGFYGLRTEWWHFTAYNWQRYVPDPDQKFTTRRPLAKSKSKL
jgi:D-alanyl-D-alanine dipeptidase